MSMGNYPMNSRNSSKEKKGSTEQVSDVNFSFVYFLNPLRTLVSRG